VPRRGVFLTEVRDFDEVNAVYGEVFADHRPGRTAVGAASLPDRGLEVAIDCIAHRV
jgi:2-iminobutanoate/2-iminopropanoate deaminase